MTILKGTLAVLLPNYQNPMFCPPRGFEARIPSACEVLFLILLLKINHKLNVSLSGNYKLISQKHFCNIRNKYVYYKETQLQG